MNAVIDYLKSNQQRFVDELCEYVRFPSVSAQPQHVPDMRACGDWLVAHCQNIGLEARLCPTDGHPIVLAKTPRPGSRKNGRPKFLIYGHYDVQPPEPFELWKSPPFEPRIEGRSLFARGASDNKGQNLAHLKAIEAYLKTGTHLPCDITFVIEGEEEVGSSSLAPFLGFTTMPSCYPLTNASNSPGSLSRKVLTENSSASRSCLASASLPHSNNVPPAPHSKSTASPAVTRAKAAKPSFPRGPAPKS